MMEESVIKDLRNLMMRVSFGSLDLLVYSAILMTNNSFEFEHKHSYFEIHLLVGGDAVFMIDGEKVHVKEGQLCWINPGVIREVKNTPLIEMRHFVVNFDLVKYNEKGKMTIVDLVDMRLFLSSINKQKFWVCDDLNQCSEVYQLICKEMEQQQFGYLVKTLSLLSRFIISTVQSIGIIGSMPAFEANTNLAYDVVSYIRRHSQEAITLASAARKFSVSQRHIARLLRDTFDTTFNKVLISFQIEHVKSYLCNTSLCAEQIAERVGFSSVGVMRENFKRSTNMTIREYRSQFIATKPELPQP